MWFKRNVFVASLKPRTVLVLSFLAIVISVLPLVVLWFAFNGMMEATFKYEDVVDVPTTDIIGLCVLVIVLLTAIFVSLAKICQIAFSAAQKRSRLRKLSKQK